MSKTALGSTALACAATDDITVWTVLAFVVAIVKAGGLAPALLTALETTDMTGPLLSLSDYLRARQAGWEQALWEGLFRALGYKHNVWPMQCLAELRPRWQTPRTQPLALQARLFGISGLLPVELTRLQTGTDHYVRRVWDQWWRERDEFSDCILPRALWRLHGSRPANHPQRRVALASRWSIDGDLAR